jgi:hypothetical protein
MEQALELGAVINPANISGGNEILRAAIDNKTRLVQVVDFEVGLTISNEENSKKGLGVMLGGLGMGANSSSTGNTSTATSIKFNVPVVLPSVDNGNTPLSHRASQGRTHHY